MEIRSVDLQMSHKLLAIDINDGHSKLEHGEQVRKHALNNRTLIDLFITMFSLKEIQTSSYRLTATAGVEIANGQLWGSTASSKQWSQNTGLTA